MTNNYWFNVGGNAGTLLPEDYTFLADNNWKVIVTVNYRALGGYSDSTSICEQYTENAQVFVDAGIPILFGIEEPMSYNNTSF